MSSVDIAGRIRAYLDGAVSLGELHGHIQQRTWGRPTDDALASGARRLIGEATTAGWAENALRDELSDLLGRREDAGLKRDALKEAVAHFNFFVVVTPGQASASPWSVEVLTHQHARFTIEKTRDQTERVPLG